MTDQEILAKLTNILHAVMLNESIVLTMETQRENVPNWDSFNYINFIVAAEIEFGVKFKVADIESFCERGRHRDRVEEHVEPDVDGRPCGRWRAMRARVVTDAVQIG